MKESTEATILDGYKAGETYASIGEKVGLSRQRVYHWLHYQQGLPKRERTPAKAEPKVVYSNACAVCGRMWDDRRRLRTCSPGCREEYLERRWRYDDRAAERNRDRARRWQRSRAAN